MPIVDSRFAWFGVWVDQNGPLTFTAVAEPDPGRVLNVFGAMGFDRGTRS